MPADLVAIGLTLYCITRFAGLTPFSFTVFGTAAAIWIVRSLIRLPRPVNKWWLSPLTEGAGDFASVLLIAGSTKILAPQVHGDTAGALVAALSLSLLTRAIGFALLGRWANRRLLESVRWAAVLLAGTYSVFPYIADTQVGSGDAYHYSLMVSDFITQLRAGVFPVFVGQSEYAFNGGIHTLRTAPYFVHFAGLLDVLSLHTLSFVALTNLAVVLSAIGGAINAYVALRLYFPSRLWSAAVIAAVYVFSPAILAPLYEGDMIATFMTVPFLPWWALSLAYLLDQVHRRRGWILQSVTLAALWWAHPPIAIWATGISVVVWIGSIVFRSGRVGQTIGAATSLVLCAILCSYVFVSVHSLHLTSIANPGASGAILANIATNLRANFRPLDVAGTGLLGDIQIGYSLLALGVAGLFCLRTRASVAALGGAFIALFVVLLPVPWLTAQIWTHVPAAILEVTNVWPGQRLYPILAALAAFLGLAATDRLSSFGKRWRLASAVLVLCAAAWSASEMRKLHRRGLAVAMGKSHSELVHRPENVNLTRSSYLLFGPFNIYFSHSRMEPFLETRLLDPATQEPFADGGTIAKTPAPRESTALTPLTIDFVQTPTGVSDAAFLIEPHSLYLLTFDFFGQELSGTVQVASHTLAREYILPTSGMEKAFGSNDNGGRTIAVENRSDAPDQVRLLLLSKDAALKSDQLLARATAQRIDDLPRVLRITSLMPFELTVNSPRAATLETPRVFIPGYRAVVNGRNEPVFSSVNKLAAVAIPAGETKVRVFYNADEAMVVTYFTAIVAWSLLILGAMLLPFIRAWQRTMPQVGRV